jgi:lipopolysaccharide assembly outer membrane protein LptD (OstA)
LRTLYFSHRLCIAAALNLSVWAAANAATTPQTAFHDAKPVTFSAPALSPNEPLSMVADSMGYDEPHGIVIAEGNVEVVQADYILRADKITFYQNDNLVRADGNVSMLQPAGDVYFADHIELTGDMKSALIKEVSRQACRRFHDCG